MKKLVASALILVIAVFPLIASVSMANFEVASTWSIETVDSAGDVGSSCSIALDSMDRPHISYMDSTNGDLKYARWTGSSWSIETVDSAGDVGSSSSIALDSMDRPHISYMDTTDGFPNYDLKYARWTGSAWSIETVDSTGCVGGYSSLALTSGGNPCIAYYDWTDYDLKYAKWTGSAWNIEFVDTTGLVGPGASLALDSSDRPHISYKYGDTYLKYAKWTGSTWSIQIVDTDGGSEDTPSTTSIALDSSDYPHISYANGYPYYDMKYARWTGSTWSIEIVDALNGYDGSSSLALDSMDRPHISYWTSNEFKLKYAFWTGSAWSTEVLDNYGHSNSIALDSSDNPHISYYYSLTWDGNLDLKYAHKIGKVNTVVDFGFAPNPAAPNETVVLSGTLEAVDIIHTPLAFQSIVLEYSPDGGTTWNYISTLTTTPPLGQFSMSFPAPAVGSYLLRARYAGSATYNPSSDTETLVVTTTKLNTVLDFAFAPNPAAPNETVVLSGTLEAVDVIHTPLAFQSIVLEYSPDGGTTWNYVTTFTTNPLGQFSMSFPAPAVGEYLLRARYAGSETYNPSSHTETLVVQLAVSPSFEIWTDKSSYTAGETMYVFVRVKNPGSALPARAIIKLGLPGGGTYGPLLDMVTTLPAGFDSGSVLWNQFTLPSVAPGTYSWIAELRNPSSGALIASDTYYWTFS